MSEKNIILLIIDTLRKDRSKPVWDVLKDRGFLSYSNVIAPSPWTIPSHASIFTGKYPILHGAHETKKKKAFNVVIRDRSGFLTDELKELGFENHLFSANPYITSSFGYSGFDHEIEILHETKFDILSNKERKELFRLRREMDSTSGMIKHLLRKGRIALLFKGILNRITTSAPATDIFHRYQFRFQRWPQEKGARKMVDHFTKNAWAGTGHPHFFMINMMEVHEPYFRIPVLSMKLNMNKDLFEKTVDEGFIRKLEDAYDNEVKRISASIDDLMRTLEKDDFLEDNLIIITSDHGQLLGEHDQLGHGTFLFDEVLRVPLFIRYPRGSLKKARKNRDGYISLTKLYDLILSMARKGSFDEEKLFSETVFAETHGISNVFEPTEDIEKEKVEQLERFKIATYSQGCKMIFDVGRFDVDEISGSEEKVPREIVERLKKKSYSFFKQLEKNNISKVKFGKNI
jgi:arylsulfatase A-like enzyme